MHILKTVINETEKDYGPIMITYYLHQPLRQNVKEDSFHCSEETKPDALTSARAGPTGQCELAQQDKLPSL